MSDSIFSAFLVNPAVATIFFQYLIPNYFSSHLNPGMWDYLSEVGVFSKTLCFLLLASF